MPSSTSFSNVADRGQKPTSAPLVSPRKLDGHFDVHVKGVTISVTLLLGSEASGRPTVTASSCSSHIRDVDVDISGGLK